MLAEKLDGRNLCVGRVSGGLCENVPELFEHGPEVEGELDFGKAVAVEQAFFVITEQQVGDDFFSVAVGEDALACGG